MTCASLQTRIFPVQPWRRSLQLGMISWVRNTAPGMNDPDVLAWAARDERTLLTFDKDFGELARASTLPSRCGVVKFHADAKSWRYRTAAEQPAHVA